MKIIGLMLTWNNVEFLKCSLPHALEFCDELILVEGCHSTQYPKHSTDGTCEYIETIKGLPKLTIKDFDFEARYDKVQLRIRRDFPKMSKFYKPGNWIFHWDDDLFFLNEDLVRLRRSMERTNRDSFNLNLRNFIYNFRFCSIERGGNAYRIVEDMFLSGVSNAHYKNGKWFSAEHIPGVVLFHYNYVKKPERFKARMAMSVEKGAKVSKPRYEQFMSVVWDKDEDIFKSKAIVESIRPGKGLHIYKGPHPEAVAEHPWRHIKDVREME